MPCGEGLLTFQSPKEVIESVSRIEANYDAHCHSARELAVNFFSGPRVLQPLIEKAMVPSVKVQKQPMELPEEAAM
jgi:hypothetical protein